MTGRRISPLLPGDKGLFLPGIGSGGVNLGIFAY